MHTGMKYYFWLIYDFKCRGSFFFPPSFFSSFFFNSMSGDLYFFSGVIDFFSRSFLRASIMVSNRWDSIDSEHAAGKNNAAWIFSRQRHTSRTCRGTVINLLTEGPERVRMNPRPFNCFVKYKFHVFRTGGGRRGDRVTYENETGVRYFERCHCNYCTLFSLLVSRPIFSNFSSFFHHRSNRNNEHLSRIFEFSIRVLSRNNLFEEEEEDTRFSVFANGAIIRFRVLSKSNTKLRHLIAYHVISIDVWLSRNEGNRNGR